MTADYTDNGDGSVKVFNRQYNTFWKNIETISGKAKCVGAKCKVVFPWIPGNGGDYRVVGTDYIKYAVVYSCSYVIFNLI